MMNCFPCWQFYILSPNILDMKMFSDLLCIDNPKTTKEKSLIL